MRVVMFDLDGTLLDTLEDIGAAANAILGSHGYPRHDMPVYRRLVGHGFRRLIAGALPPDVAEAMAPAALTALVDAARAWYGRHMCEHTRPYAGIPEALAELAAQGRVLAVLSNKPHEHTRAIISHFFPDVPFALVRGGRDDAPLKPDPAVPRAMLADLHAAPGQAFYVGDSDVDVCTARNAGMVSVGVSWGFRGAAELRDAGAEHIITDPGELTGLTAEA